MSLPEIKPSSAEATPRKVFIKTYGCQMNVYDSERMGDALTTSGYVKTDDAEEADLVLVNTCHIREKATEKIYSEIGRLRKLRKRRQASGADLKIAIAGCVAQAEGEAMIKRAPEVDLVIGPQTYHRLPFLLKRTEAGEKVVETEYGTDDKYALLPTPQEKRVRASGVSAFLTVQEGCDKFCAFCVVPYTRGNEHSRSVAQIKSEAEKLVANGVRELTLLGQNVNAWHGADANGKEAGLAALLYALADIPELKRLRYTTSHPRDMDEALINAHRDLPKLMPFLHLPVQSGSDRILKAMNRRHTNADYMRTIEKIKRAQPEIALSSDFIVGFPGETDTDFEATLQLIRDVGFASSYTFKYSARPGTPAADMALEIDAKVADARLLELQNLIIAQQAAFLSSLVGKTIDVLVEKPGREDGQFIGRSPWLIPVVLPANNSNIGDIVSVRIGEAGRNTLNAEGLVQSVAITGLKTGNRVVNLQE